MCQVQGRETVLGVEVHGNIGLDMNLHVVWGPKENGSVVEEVLLPYGFRTWKRAVRHVQEKAERMDFGVVEISAV